MESVVNNNNVEVVQQPKVLRAMATVVSYVLHPVFMPTVMAFVLYKLTPVSFMGMGNDRMGGFGWLAMIGLNSLFFPLLVVALLKGLGMNKSFLMDDPRERIIPLLSVMIFYFWMNHVMGHLSNMPLILHVLTLGSFWGIIVIFMINIFFKISMHTAAAGSMLGLLIVLMIISPVNMLEPFSIALVVAGIAGTARMLLNAHRMSEIWAGYIVGLVVMLAAYGYLLW